MAHNNRKPNMLPYTLKDFQKQFPDDATCLEWLKNRLFPDGIYCETCEAVTKHHRVKSRPSYSCDYCGHHVHPTADTIFHKSPTPLTTWFYAVYLMAQTRCGISAKQIQRETGVTYKTAWRMFKQIRSMLTDERVDPIGGFGRKVEMDETYYGERDREGTRRARNQENSGCWDGAAQRSSSGIRRRRRESRYTCAGLIKEHVLPRTMVFTDDFKSYNGIGARGYTHQRINHSEKVYVNGDVHTNTIEGFWSLD